MSEMVDEHAHDTIHIPAPNFWPLVLGAGVLVLAFGLVLKEVRLIVAPIGLLVLAVGMGGWLFSNICDRLDPHAYIADTKMAMWMFLGSEVMFFTGLIATFLLLRARAPADVGHVLNIPVTAVNTFILLTSSLTVVLALDAAQKNRQGQLKLFLLATIVLGTVFVSVQGYEYTKLFAEGLLWNGANAIPYGTAFFTLTGFHGTHVAIGVIWCLVVLFRALRGGFDAKNFGGVEIFGLYWHFVDIVWILLFTLIYLMQ